MLTVTIIRLARCAPQGLLALRPIARFVLVRANPTWPTNVARLQTEPARMLVAASDAMGGEHISVALGEARTGSCGGSASGWSLGEGRGAA